MPIYTDADGHRQRDKNERNSQDYEHEDFCLWSQLLFESVDLHSIDNSATIIHIHLRRIH